MVIFLSFCFSSLELPDAFFSDFNFRWCGESGPDSVCFDVLLANIFSAVKNSKNITRER